MRLIAILVIAFVSPYLWAQDCKQTIVGGASFWSCDDQDQALAERAEQGDKTAQYQMGMHYLQGKNIDQDYQRAAYWFGKSAEQGVAASYYQLGLLYAEGNGVEKNAEQAVAVWSLASLKGHGEAQFRLAESYDQGLGIGQDLLQAYAWYSLSVASMLVPMEKAIERRDALQAQLSDGELESAEVLRKSLYQQILMNKLMR